MVETRRHEAAVFLGLILPEFEEDTRRKPLDRDEQLGELYRELRRLAGEPGSEAEERYHQRFAELRRLQEEEVRELEARLPAPSHSADDLDAALARADELISRFGRLASDGPGVEGTLRDGLDGREPE